MTTKRARRQRKDSKEAPKGASFGYTVADGSPYSEEDIRKIVPTLLALNREHGGLLKPKHILEAAADPESPLHEHFDWNNQTAAHKYRVVQARKLIKAIRYWVVTGKTETKLPVFHRVLNDGAHLPNADKGRGYVTLATAAHIGDFREQLLAEALQDLRMFKARYAKLSDSFTSLRGIFDAIARFERVVAKKQKSTA